MVESLPNSGGKAVRVFFLGSGALGVPVLDTLHNSRDIHLAGVGSQPDRCAGRRRALTPTALAEHASRLGYEVLKPASVNAPEFTATVRSLTPEIIVVVAFGQFLKDEMLNLADFGCLNVHASLLPRYRGASPINAAILAGDRQTGISFMRLDQGMDSGPVYHQTEVPVCPEDTAGTLEQKLAITASENIIATLIRICRNGLQPVAQDNSIASYAGKLDKCNGIINWREDAEAIERAVRAYQPWPRATCFFSSDGDSPARRLQITSATVISAEGNTNNQAAPGKIMLVQNGKLTVACGRNMLEIRTLIPENGREMTTAEFLRGIKITHGAVMIADTYNKLYI